MKADRNYLAGWLDIVEARLVDTPYLSGARFCLADAYLFTCCRWLGAQDLAVADWPGLARHSGSVGDRKTVGAALAAEGPSMPEPVT